MELILNGIFALGLSSVDTLAANLLFIGFALAALGTFTLTHK